MTATTHAALRTAAEVLKNVVGDDAPSEYVAPLRQACAALAPVSYGPAEQHLRAEDMPRNQSVHLRIDVVDALLKLRGWTLEPVRGGFAFVKPGRTLRADGGKFGTDYLWERDEALTVALTAEALA